MTACPGPMATTLANEPIQQHGITASGRLLYFGREMVREPTNMTWLDMIARLRMGQQVAVILEPGDASRYTLLITWALSVEQAFYFGDSASDALLVTRVIGGHILGSVLFGWMNYGAVVGIAQGNEWTGKLLAWWLEAVLAELSPPALEREPDLIGEVAEGCNA